MTVPSPALSLPIAAGLILMLLFQDVKAQVVPSVAPTYADVADLADQSTAVVRVRVRSAVPVDAARAPGVLPGWMRYYATADVTSLIRGNAPLSKRIAFLYEMPVDAGKQASWKKRDLLLFGHLVPGRSDQFRLTGRRSVLDWSPESETLTRNIAGALVAADAPPRVTGVARAFHVKGSITGESETQIFLSTDNDEPISMSVLRRPGQTPLLSVALGEIVDEAAGRPKPDTLLWYRLACFLPDTLPASVATSLDAAARDGAIRDYRLLRTGLGDCRRTSPAD